MSEFPLNQNPKLLRRLLRAKDRMDAASHEDWSVRRLAEVSHVSEAHFARSFKEALKIRDSLLFRQTNTRGSKRSLG